MPKLEPAADQLLSKILPAQFTGIYIDVFEGYAPTGFPHLSVFEDERSFPYLDFTVISSLFTKLGLWKLLTSDTLEGFKRFLQFRQHPNFSEFVRAKDRLLYVLTHAHGGKVPHRAAIAAAVRTLPIRELAEDSAPYQAAIEIYRASEVLAKDAAGGLVMPDALTWKGQYLIVTATDLEDRIFQRALDERGFSSPVVINDERFSYIERFRSDVGRIFHLRTSAGSGGASGAFIMGKNAVERLNPKYIISVGICFGLREKSQALGDVVVSEMIHDYEKQRVSKERPEDRGATRESSPQLLSRARANVIIWTKATVHIGTVLSGEKLVDDAEFRATLLTLQPPAIAGEMEAWGLSAVCHETRKHFIMVKGICDWGMNKEKDHQEEAARNACAFALDALVVAENW